MVRRIVASTSEERDLLIAAGSGDADAFGELYRRYLSDVRDFCARRVSDRIRAEDLAQDTFVKAFEQMANFRTGAPFWPWLSTIARNLCIDELRRARRMREESCGAPPEPAPSPVDPTIDEVLACETRRWVARAVNAALESLGPRDRRLLWHRAVDEMSWDEVARVDRSSVHAARNAAWRARGLLRAALGGVLEDLRSWIGLVFATVALRARRAFSRIQSRAGSAWTIVGQAVSERLAEVLAAVTVLCVGFVGAAAAASAASASGEIRRPAADAPAQRLPSTPPGSTSGHAHPYFAALGRPVDVYAATETRPHAVIPSRGYYRVEVRGPDGRLLLSDATTMRCGDGRQSSWLPEGAPVRAYC